MIWIKSTKLTAAEYCCILMQEQTDVYVHKCINITSLSVHSLDNQWNLMYCDLEILQLQYAHSKLSVF